MKTVLVHVTENNQVWAAQMTGLPLEKVRQRYQMDKAAGVLCVMQAQDRGTRNLDEHPLFPTAFISGDDTIINMGGNNYYLACSEMVSEHQGCVKRQGHLSEHEDYYGNTKVRS